MHDNLEARLEIGPWLEAARRIELGSVVDNSRVLGCLGSDHNRLSAEGVLLAMYVSGLMGNVAVEVALGKTWLGFGLDPSSINSGSDI